VSGQQAVLQVVILRDGLLVGTEVLVPGVYVIGSEPGADLRLDDASVGARHAVIYFQNGKVAIQDGGAPTGVYVNGTRVTACQVRSVDEVLCGPFVLKARVLSHRPSGEHLPPEVAALLGVAGQPPGESLTDDEGFPLLTALPGEMVGEEAGSTTYPSDATVPSARLRASGEHPRVVQGTPRLTGERPAPAALPRSAEERPVSSARSAEERASAPPRSSGERGAFPPRSSGQRPGMAPQRSTGERVASASETSRNEGGEAEDEAFSSRPTAVERATPAPQQSPRASGERPEPRQPPRASGERAQAIPPRASGERAQVLPPRASGERAQAIPPRASGERPQVIAPRSTGERPQAVAPRSTGERPQAIAPRSTGERPQPAAPPRSTGERPRAVAPRSTGERPQPVAPRSTGERPQAPSDAPSGERAPPSSPRASSERGAMPPRSTGERAVDGLPRVSGERASAAVPLAPAVNGLAPTPFGDLFDEAEARAANHGRTRVRPEASPDAPAEARAVSNVDTVRVPIEGKGAPRLYLELYWGDVRAQARSFPTGEKKPILAAPREDAALPVYGLALPDVGFLLAEAGARSFRVFVPPNVAVERCTLGEPFVRVEKGGVDADKGRSSLMLSLGMAARFTQGAHSLVAYVAPTPEKVAVNRLKDVPWVAFGSFAVMLAAFGAFVAFSPKQPDIPDFTAKGLPPVAVRLIAPEPKKREEAKKKLEEIKAAPKEQQKKTVPDKVAEKAVKVVEKTVPKAVAAAPETKALKALAKLSAAGPAMNDLLAAVDRLGNGPGSKNAKANNYKLSGLIGKAPLANAGLGTFGLGGGGKGGGATLGAELLRGKGGGGIGAMGAGSIGKGTVGGTVSHATARSVAVPQGSIDREAVAKVINSHLQEVRACYERALLKEPSLSGKVVLEWGIGGSGAVVSVKTKTSSLRSSTVEGCIINEIKRWQFPAPRGGSVLISYPFLFNSVGY